MRVWIQSFWASVSPTESGTVNTQGDGLRWTLTWPVQFPPSFRQAQDTHFPSENPVSPMRSPCVGGDPPLQLQRWARDQGRSSWPAHSTSLFTATGPASQALPAGGEHLCGDPQASGQAGRPLPFPVGLLGFLLSPSPAGGSGLDGPSR